MLTFRLACPTHTIIDNFQLSKQIAVFLGFLYGNDANTQGNGGLSVVLWSLGVCWFMGFDHVE